MLEANGKIFMTLDLAMDSQMTTESMSNKKIKIGKLDLIKIKYIFAPKDIIKKVKRQLKG